MAGPDFSRTYMDDFKSTSCFLEGVRGVVCVYDFILLISVRYLHCISYFIRSPNHKFGYYIINKNMLKTVLEPGMCLR